MQVYFINSVIQSERKRKRKKNTNYFMRSKKEYIKFAIIRITKKLNQKHKIKNNDTPLRPNQTKTSSKFSMRL